MDLARLGFELAGHLGDRGPVTVWRDPDSSRRFCLKVVRDAQTSPRSPDEPSEYEILCALGGVGLPRPQGWLRLAEGEAFLYEYVEGSPIGSIRLPPDVAEFDRVATDALLAVFLLHEAGVCHYDLSPNNIIVAGLGGECSATLLDVGHAGRRGKTLLGTPGYVAPEILSGEPGGPESDLFSLGVVLAEYALGERLFRGRTQREMLSNYRGGVEVVQTALATSLGAARSRFLEKLLSLDRNQRLSDAGEALGAYKSIAPDLAIEKLRCATEKAAITAILTGLRETSGWQEALRNARTGSSAISVHVHTAGLGPNLLCEASSTLARAGVSHLVSPLCPLEVGSLVPEDEKILRLSEAGAGEDCGESSVRLQTASKCTRSQSFTIAKTDLAAHAEAVLKGCSLEPGTRAWLRLGLEEALSEGCFDLRTLFTTLFDKGRLGRTRRRWMLTETGDATLSAGISAQALATKYGDLEGEAFAALQLLALSVTRPHVLPRELATGVILALNSQLPNGCIPDDISQVLADAVLSVPWGQKFTAVRNSAFERLESDGNLLGESRRCLAELYLRDKAHSGLSECLYGMLRAGEMRCALDAARRLLNLDWWAEASGGEFALAAAWCMAEGQDWQAVLEIVTRCPSRDERVRSGIELLKHLANRSLLEGASKKVPGVWRSDSVPALPPAILLLFEVDASGASSSIERSQSNPLAAMFRGLLRYPSPSQMSADDMLPRSFNEQWATLDILASLVRESAAGGNRDGTMELVDAAEALAGRLCQERWVQRFKLTKGTLEYRRGNKDLAVTLLGRVRCARLSAGDELGYAEVLGKMASMDLDGQSADECASAWERSLALQRARGAFWDAAKTCGQLGNARFEQGRFRDALELYSVSIDESMRRNDDGIRVRYWHARVLASLNLGDLDSAERESRLLVTWATERETPLAESSRVLSLRRAIEFEVGLRDPCGRDTATRDCLAQFTATRRCALMSLYGSDEYFTQGGEAVPDSTSPEAWVRRVMCADHTQTGPEVVRSALEQLTVMDGLDQAQGVDILLSLVLLLLSRGERLPRSLSQGLVTLGCRMEGLLTRFKALSLSARAAWDLGEPDQALDDAEQALRILRSSVGSGQCLGPNFRRRIDYSTLLGVAAELAGEPNGPAGREVDGGDDLLERIATMLRNAREKGVSDATGRASRWQRGLERILLVSEGLAGARKLDTLLEQVVDSLLMVTSAEHGFVVLVDRAGNRRVQLAKGKAGDPGEEVRETVSQTIISQAIEERKARLVRNALDDESLTNQPSIQRMEVRSIMVAPLLHQGELLGVMYVDNRTAAGCFDDDDLRLLEVFANHAAVAVQSSRMFEELQGAYRSVAEAHDRLVRSERLKQVGEIASGVAHDFNNLLTAILMRAQMLQSGPHDEEEMQELRLIERAALDGASAIRRLQDFTRLRPREEFGRVRMREVIEESVELTRGRWGRGASTVGGRACRVEVGELEDVEILGSGPELREVFVNLIVNGVEAMPAGGCVRIAARSASGEMHVEVADEGTGMSAETLKRLFEPFFTTKGVRGNGLGLSVAQGIIVRHGGRIEVDSEEGKGSRFTVCLPVGEEPPQKEELTDASVPRLDGLRILVVDDDEAVLTGIVSALKGLGAEVTSARDVGEALRLCSEEAFAAVVSDYRMPGQDGAELFKTLESRGYPALRVLVTGSLDPYSSDQNRRPETHTQLRKPFTARDLAGALRPLL